MSDSRGNHIFFVLEVVAPLLEPSKRPREIECDTRFLCYDQRFSHGFKDVLTVVGGFPVCKSSEGKVQGENWQIKLQKRDLTGVRRRHRWKPIRVISRSIYRAIASQGAASPVAATRPLQLQ